MATKSKTNKKKSASSRRTASPRKTSKKSKPVSKRKKPVSGRKKPASKSKARTRPKSAAKRPASRPAAKSPSRRAKTSGKRKAAARSGRPAYKPKRAPGKGNATATAKAKVAVSATKRPAVKANRIETRSSRTGNHTQARPRVRRGDADLGVGEPLDPRGLGADAGGQSGDTEGLSREELADSESVEELIEEGQSFEAGIVSGVENAPDADQGGVRTRQFQVDDVPEEYLDDDRPGKE